MTFRTALLVSAIVHSAVFLPLQRTTMPERMAEDKKPIVVDYVKIKDPEIIEAAQATAEIVEPPKAAETPKGELKPKVEAKPSLDALSRHASSKAKEDYINYYQLIREKIRQRLKRNYTDYYGEGDVNVAFVLDSGGSLVSVSAERASPSVDKTLAGITEQSVREAAPFPAFPKTLAQSKTSFELIVAFRKR